MLGTAHSHRCFNRDVAPPPGVLDLQLSLRVRVAAPHVMFLLSVTASGLLVLLLLGAARAGNPWSHNFGTVADMMGMHGKYTMDAPPSDADIKFAADHYLGGITTGTGCPHHWNTSFGTIEDSVQEIATRIKSVNPDRVVGMYIRTPFALELSTCSRFMDEWAAHPEWRLKDDNGTLITRGTDVYWIDYSVPAAAEFFANVVLNVTAAVLPTGKPVLDYVYLDGAGGCDVGPSGGCEVRKYTDGVGIARSSKITDAKYVLLFGMGQTHYRPSVPCGVLTSAEWSRYAMIATIQAKMDSRGMGQGLVLNGMDNLPTAAAHVATGAVANMFDHWTILQFIDTATGVMDATAMDDGFKMGAYNQRTEA